MKEQEDIDQLFKSAFDDFAVAPPPAVKESVDLAIAAGKPKRFTGWILAVIALITVAVAAGIFLLNHEEKTQLAAKTQQESQHDPVSATPGESHSSQDHVTEKTAGNGSTEGTDGQHAVKGTHLTDPTSNLNPGKTTASRVASQESNPGKRISQGSASGGNTRGTSRQPKQKRAKNSDISSAQPGNSLQDPLTSASAGSARETAANAGDAGKNSPNGTPTPNEDPKQAPVKQPSQTEEASKTEKAALKDTLTPYAEEDTTLTDPKNKRKDKPGLLLSLKPGTTFGFNKYKDSSVIRLQEKNAFFIQAEATYALSTRLAVTSGLSYETWKENLSKPSTQLDTTITGYYYTYITDSMGIVTDSVQVPIYSFEATTSEVQNSYKLYSIGIPVFFTYSQSLTDKLNLDLSAGAILGIQGSRTVSKTFDVAGTAVNKFGLKTCLRAQLRYQFSSWGVSLNTNFGYDLFPVNSSLQLGRTSRTFLNVGAGVHYQLGK